MSKENFKAFAKNHPELLEFIKSGEMTWQKFYEIYDIYGEEERAWKDYLNKNGVNGGINAIKDIIKNIDTNSIQKHINSAQKAIEVVQEFTGKSNPNISNNTFKGPSSPRPLNKFFED